MHQQFEGQPRNKPRKSGDNSAAAILKNSRQVDKAAENQFDFTEGHKSFGTDSQCAVLEKHSTSHESSGKQRSTAWCDSAHQSSRAQCVRSEI